jgi:hypothetical protein
MHGSIPGPGPAPLPGPPNWQQREYGHVDKKARRDPQAPLFLGAAQQQQQLPPAVALAMPPGSSPGSGKRGRHGKQKHGKRQQQQQQASLEALPTASNYLEAYPAVEHLMQRFK